MKVFKMAFRCWALLASVLVTPGVLAADTLKFDFTGIVESINDGAGATLSGGLGPYMVSDTLSGSFTLDTALITGGLASITVAAGAVDNLSVVIRGNTFTNTAAGVATLRNNFGGRDLFTANFESISGPSVGTDPVTRFQFSIGGTDAIVVLSNTEAPSIAQFLDLFNNDNNDGNTKFLSFDDPNFTNPLEQSDVRFDVTSLSVTEVSAVPLPAGLSLMLVGLGGLGALRVRKRQA